jgi:hypothetical protein
VVSPSRVESPENVVILTLEDEIAMMP